MYLKMRFGSSGKIHLPNDGAFYPNAQYLKFHRDKVFKG
jgi:putative restriction endonuclease